MSITQNNQTQNANSLSKPSSGPDDKSKLPDTLPDFPQPGNSDPVPPSSPARE
jgi:hypothetical protein